MGEFEGKVALVSGGSRGIGRAVCAELAAAGAMVAVIGRNGEAAAAAAKALPGSGHAGYACDVGDYDAATETVKLAEEELGPIYTLVNNAGITRDTLLLRMKSEDWDEVMRVNLKGAFNMTRAACRGLMKRREGSIINVSSVVGLMGNAGQANYAASKAGLHGFTKSVARELAPRGVRCNAVAPGYIRTDMTSGLDQSVVEELQAHIPMERLGEPEDVASVICFLAGPGARYITGQVITVDGGMVM
ncbi:MAG: 3-oxoacyl-[acyl-carrier-protein] reductase [Gemmatimonadota bacterium]|nr:MAG: 3-oxoacyl-[acyl-carrier-protein] reductase [Gemmatimonadota bacterium]